MSAPRQDFMGQYRAISSKLKKRFLRKPNVSEASTKYGELAKKLEGEECHNYAAFCYSSVAKCENTLGNPVEESQALVKAAHLFLEAEELNHDLLCPGFSENLNAALSTYNSAIKVYQEQNQPALAASICLEVGQALEDLDRIAEAIPYYKKAATFQTHCALDYLNTLQRIVNCKIQTGDYDTALDVLTEVCDIAEEKAMLKKGYRTGAYSSILADTEVMKLLLLLFLQPPEQKLSPSNAKTMKKYKTRYDGIESPAPYLDEELFLLMQSFVSAYYSKETDICFALQKDMWNHLTPEQNDMLQKVIEKLL